MVGRDGDDVPSDNLVGISAICLSTGLVKLSDGLLLDRSALVFGTLVL